MGNALEYQEFDSIEDYRDFFRKCQDENQNFVQMYIPDKKGRRVLTKVLVTDPNHDHNLAKALLDRFKDVKWKIVPVHLTQERKKSTDKKNYRVRLRKHLVGDYRRDMRKGAFFPLLVLVLDENFWASGRHRAEAAEKDYEAVFALVVEHLTPSQLLFISDTTNRWHSEKWDGDEYANLAYDYHMIDGMTIANALLHVGLDSKDKDLFQAVQLWRRFPEINITGKQGHPIYFPNLTKVIVPYLGHFQSGVDETDQLTEEQWRNIVWDKTGTTKKVSAAYGGGEHGFGKLDGRIQLERYTRKAWVLEGDTIKKKYKHFLLLKKRIETDRAANQGGVKEVTDEQRWIAFVKSFRHLDNSAFVTIQQHINEEMQEESRKLIYRLNLVFGD